PEHIVLRQRSGMRRAILVDTAEAGLVGACDGTLTVGAIVSALATLLEEDENGLRVRLLPRVRQFVEEGYLALPADGREAP
ncbi:MAG TPA: transferase, partial [Actinopolymorphaceae bacterium]|nr:transferase [Actinopolymorphaceae bacterium]